MKLIFMVCNRRSAYYLGRSACGPDRVKTQNASRYNQYWLAQASQSYLADGCRHRFILRVYEQPG